MHNKSLFADTKLSYYSLVWASKLSLQTFWSASSSDVDVHETLVESLEN